MPCNILFSGSFATGGVQTQISLLAKLLTEAGHQVTCCPTRVDWKRQDVNSLRNLGVTVVRPIITKYEAMLVWPWLLKRDYDLLYCIGHSRIHTYFKRFLRKSGVAVYHEILDCPRPGSVTENVLPAMDYIVANSNPVQERMKARWPDKVIDVIPFLTKSDAYPIPKIRSPKGDGVVHICFLGRLAKHKRAPDLVYHWNTLEDEVGVTRLDVYGDEPQANTLNELRDWIDKENLSHMICCHGAYGHGDLDKILDNVDIVVLPSEWEGLPLVLVEAMGRGIPIVATDVGGTSDFGKENPNVIITSPRWADFWRGLKEMIARVRMGTIDNIALHEWTESRYGFDVVSERWRKVFQMTGKSCSW